jgi:hypothetical protein
MIWSFLPLLSVRRGRSMSIQCSCFVLADGPGDDSCGFINGRHRIGGGLPRRRSVAVCGSSGDGCPGSKKKVLRCKFSLF